MTPSAVIFDCDGVLVDSEPITNAVIAANLGRHGLVIPVDEVMGLFVGGTMDGVFSTAQRMGAALPDDWVDGVYREIFAALAAGTPAVPGVAEALEAIGNAGIAVAVGSNGPHAKMEVTLGQHPVIRSRFGAHVYSREDVARPKPAPDLYLHAARALGVAAERCVVIEDSPSGARAAQAAGMLCYGYAPTGADSRLVEAGARPFAAMTSLPGLLGL